MNDALPIPADPQIENDFTRMSLACDWSRRRAKGGALNDEIKYTQRLRTAQVLLGLPTALGFAGMPGAHCRGCAWPGQKAMLRAAARRHELQSSPAYQALQSRNERLEGWSVTALLIAIAVAVAPLWPLRLCKNNDLLSLWLVGLMFGLIVTRPAILLFAPTRPRGHARRPISGPIGR